MGCIHFREIICSFFHHQYNLLVCLLLTLVMTACHQPESESISSESVLPLESAETIIAESKPKLSFKDSHFDFGQVGFAKTTLEHRFEFVNEGNAPLNILEVKKTCSCVVNEISKRVLQPGEEGYIDVKLELATIALQEKTGLLERSVFVSSSDPENPMVELTLRGTRARNHFYYPSHIDFGAVSLGETITQQLNYIPRNEVTDKGVVTG